MNGKEKFLVQKVFSVNASKKDDSFMLACWHKHPAINFWMKSLQNARFFSSKNKNSINTYVKLCDHDIDSLKFSIIKGNLNFNKHGSMIGKSFKNDYKQKQLDLKFITLAKEELKKGRELIYISYITNKSDSLYECKNFLSKKRFNKRDSMNRNKRNISRNSKNSRRNSSFRKIFNERSKKIERLPKRRSYNSYNPHGSYKSSKSINLKNIKKSPLLKNTSDNYNERSIVKKPDIKSFIQSDKPKNYSGSGPRVLMLS